MTDFEEIVNADLPWRKFEGATVLVTGASGFLPAYMVKTLLHLNRHVFTVPCRITARVRDYDRAIRVLPPSWDLQLVVGDASRWFDSFSGYDYVIHAASPASPKVYLRQPVEAILPNVLGTQWMLSEARHCKGFLFFSSGDAACNIDPLDPRSCYGESKRMGETLCMAYHRQYGVPIRIARISHTYGPGMKLDDGRVFADFTRDILAGGPIVLNSDGLAQRPFLYLSEATEAFFRILLMGKAEAYNVAHPEIMSIGYLADRLAAEFDLTVERRVIAGSQGPQGDQPDIGKLRALGWTPRIAVEEGFRRTVESYR